MRNVYDEIYEEREKPIRKETSRSSSTRRRATDETVKKKGKIVKTNLLNVRQTPKNEGANNVIGQLKAGESVQIIGKEGDYYRIKYNKGEAYILSDFCECKEE